MPRAQHTNGTPHLATSTPPGGARCHPPFCGRRSPALVGTLLEEGVLLVDDAAVAALAECTCAGGVRPRALDVGSPALTDACLPALSNLADAGLTSLKLWHTDVTRAGIMRLMGATRGLGIDTSMASSDGTYLLRQVGW